MHATALFAFTWALWGGQVGRLEKGLPQIFWGSGSAEHSSQMQSLCLLGSTMCVCVCPFQLTALILLIDCICWTVLGWLLFFAF